MGEISRVKLDSEIPEIAGNPRLKTFGIHARNGKYNFTLSTPLRVLACGRCDLARLTSVERLSSSYTLVARPE